MVSGFSLLVPTSHRSTDEEPRALPCHQLTIVCWTDARATA